MGIDLEPSDFKKLDVAIIGAGLGIGGLVTALALAKKGFTEIRIYEAAADLGFVGAGIQLAPNLVRILSRLGCWDKIGAEAINILETSIRDGASDRELAHVHMDNIRERYHYPHCTGHRASLVDGLYKACREEPSVTFEFGVSLQSVDSFAPRAAFTLLPNSGDAYQREADVLIGADGIKSAVRSDLLACSGNSISAQDTGQAAYRILLPREKMKGDAEMMDLLDSNQVTRWIGEKRHWIAYPIASRTIYNLSSIQPDVNFAASPSTTYTTKGSKDAMLQVFSDFCPVIQRMLHLVPDGEVCEWKLRMHKPLPTWVHGSVALVGDACHPTLPHLNQGAGMAVEDAAVLAEVLARAPDASPKTINRCLQVYEKLRKERTTTLVELAAASGRALHLGESAAKEERDRQFAEAVGNGGKVPDKWASPDVQAMIYSHDCMAVANDEFEKLYNQVPT